MDEIVANAVRQQRVSAVLIASFALGALLLAAMGLFGMISGSVLRRAHEFDVHTPSSAWRRQAFSCRASDIYTLLGRRAI